MLDTLRQEEYRTRAIITCIFSTPFFTAVYILEWLMLQTIYVINKEIRQFLGLKFAAVTNQERVITVHIG